MIDRQLARRAAVQCIAAESTRFAEEVTWVSAKAGPCWAEGQYVDPLIIGIVLDTGSASATRHTVAAGGGRRKADAPGGALLGAASEVWKFGILAFAVQCVSVSL